MEKVKGEQSYTGITGVATVPTSKAWKWRSRLAIDIVLVLLGLHAWIQYSPRLRTQQGPFSVIPAGEAGDMFLAPCGNGLECGYIKYFLHPLELVRDG
jgi:hypothetical protein